MCLCPNTMLRWSCSSGLCDGSCGGCLAIVRWHDCATDAPGAGKARCKAKLLGPGAPLRPEPWTMRMEPGFRGDGWCRLWALLRLQLRCRHGRSKDDSNGTALVNPMIECPQPPYKHLGRSDILVSHAPTALGSSILDTPSELFDWMIKTNIYAPFWMIRELCRTCRQERRSLRPRQSRHTIRRRTCTTMRRPRTQR